MGLGTCAVKYACRWSTGTLFSTSVGMKFWFIDTGSRRVRFPT